MRAWTLLVPLALLALHADAAARPGSAYSAIDDVGGAEQKMPVEMDQRFDMLASLLRKSRQSRQSIHLLGSRSCFTLGTSCTQNAECCSWFCVIGKCSDIHKYLV